MKKLKLATATLLVILGLTENGSTKNPRKTATLYWWYTNTNVPLTTGPVAVKTLASELVSAGGPYFTTTEAGHYNPKQFGYTTAYKSQRVYTLYK